MHSTFKTKNPQNCLSSIQPCSLFLFAVLTLNLSWAQAQQPLELEEGTQTNTDQTVFISSEVRAQLNVAITMRDGIKLYVDIYRPAGNGKFPTLYASAPFPHNRDSTPPTGPLTGPVSWFVEQGYAYVLASTRGTGLSEGDYEFLSRNEQQDHYEVVEWIAEQEWSNSKIAGVGASYYGTSQWMMASQSPPHLECIAPQNGILSPYHDWAYPGGLLNNQFSLEWYEQQVRQPNAFPLTGTPKIVNFDLRLQQLLHPYYDDYWRLRSSFERLSEITIPAFIIRSWNSSEAGLNGTLNALTKLRNTNKIYIYNDNNGFSPLQDPAFLENELLPFYEWCLNDDQFSSFIEKPSIRYHVRGQDQLKRESSWPPSNIEPSPVYLNKQIVNGAEASSINFTSLPNNISNSAYGLGTNETSITFVSDTLEQDIEIAGSLMMELYASSSSTDTGFEIRLSEQFILPQARQPSFQTSFLNQDEGNPEPALLNSSVLVSQGSLKASSRATDPTLNQPNQAFYLFENSNPIIPGQVTRFDIALQPTAYRFKQGNRLVIEVRKTNDDTLTSSPSRDTFYHNDRYPSRLWLPIAQTASSLLVEELDTEPELSTSPIIEGSPAADFDFLYTEESEEEIPSPVIPVR